MNDKETKELEKMLIQVDAIDNIERILEQLKNQTDMKAMRQELLNLQKSVTLNRHEVTQLDKTLDTVTKLQIAQNQELLAQRENISRLIDVLSNNTDSKFSMPSFAAGSVSGAIAAFILLTLIVSS